MFDYMKSKNDYDYCLVHLLPEQQEYLNYFKKVLLTDREVILDNSIFELGKAFEAKSFVKWVEDLKPTYYIVPDELDNARQTVDNYHNFKKEYIANLPGVPMGVVQGMTYNDIVMCYKRLTEEGECQYVGISFDMKYFEVTGRGPTNRHRQLTGRQALINRLIQEGIWRTDIQHHLLGCSLPQEFRYYVDNNIPAIKSLDTSNPVVCGLQGVKYQADFGLQTKPSVKLFELINSVPTADQIDTISYNLEMFRRILRQA